MIIATLLSLAGIGVMLWLLFVFAIYALPFYAGFTAAFLAYEHDAGWLGAGLVGLLTGAAVLLVGQVLFATLRSAAARAIVAAVYAIPAGVAGYHAVHGLSAIGGMGEAWRVGFSVIGAAMVAVVAWARVSALYPGDSGRDVVRPPHNHRRMLGPPTRAETPPSRLEECDRSGRWGLDAGRDEARASNELLRQG